ncbi:transcriptional regulator [Paenibacillus glucanolyticus]|uniref:Transcriptional regulator n=1 Tax=Paenibacillus glucanolyticus TaxID=59843 RepID=A0A163DTP1_9BACL|nr:metalloregulator ArsR/SmtB family transcription factor [Paenibacillus glucanolyticus]KZS43427.1 transcriptional regulator [Paenibacillus glucanolyticus]
MERLEIISDKLKLLGDKTRLTMLILLTEREWCVYEFVHVLHMSQPGVSQHLRKLKSLGIVNEERRGQWVYYSLNVADKPYIQAVLNEMPSPQDMLKQLNKSDMKY